MLSQVRVQRTCDLLSPLSPSTIVVTLEIKSGLKDNLADTAVSTIARETSNLEINTDDEYPDFVRKAFGERFAEFPHIRGEIIVGLVFNSKDGVNLLCYCRPSRSTAKKSGSNYSSGGRTETI